jgi:RNA polymerase sigma-54 factor
MALVQKLLLRQTQSLVMTPQLMQAIKLLQLSHLDLAAYVEGEVERNPLLEAAGQQDGGQDRDAAEVRDHDDGADPRAEPPAEAAADGFMEDRLESRQSIEARLDTDLNNVFPDDGEAAARPVPGEPAAYADWGGGGSAAGRDGDWDLEAFVSAETTLVDHLAEQASMTFTDPVDRMVAQYLVDLVDEAGYLPADLSDATARLGATAAQIEIVVARLQSFDPPGVCARNLAECLAIQLRDRDRLDPAMQAMLAHLELIARRDFAGLRRVCGVGDEDLTDMIAEIRHLNPKPGLAFGSVVVQPIVPDVFVRRGPDGSFTVELNHDTLPKVLVNQSYYAQVSKTARKDTDKSYLAGCLQTATWLVRALDQRARTILKVATEIVRQQDAFFIHGVQYLRPLNLKTVADAIEMHESTVSRVTANKYIAAARGTFEMKFFFTSAIASADGGEAHSAEAVRYRIRQLVDAESAHAIMSDDAIVEALRGAGIDIARRTVAKYREAMRIPSSVQRRRDKQQTLRIA